MKSVLSDSNSDTLLSGPGVTQGNLEGPGRPGLEAQPAHLQAGLGEAFVNTKLLAWPTCLCREFLQEFRKLTHVIRFCNWGNTLQI